MTTASPSTLGMWMVGVCCVYLVGVWLTLLVFGMQDGRRQTHGFLFDLAFDLAVAMIWPPFVVGSVIVATGDWIESTRPRLSSVLKEAWFWLTALFRPYSLGRRLGRKRI